MNDEDTARVLIATIGTRTYRDSPGGERYVLAGFSGKLEDLPAVTGKLKGLDLRMRGAKL